MGKFRRWFPIGEEICTRCGEKAKFHFEYMKTGIFGLKDLQETTYCKKCLLNKLKEEKLN